MRIIIIRKMRLIAITALLALPVVAPAAPMTVHLLDYVAVDYAEAVADGEVINELEYTEMLDFAAEVARRLEELPEAPERDALLADAAALAAAVEAKAAPDRVREQAVALRDAVIDAYDVPTVPDEPPDPALGARLYQTSCASCHGATGRGDGPAGVGLDPAPSDFHDVARMAQRGVHGLYNTITLGVEGTGMAAYTQLSDEERWALAYHVKSYTADGPIALARASLADSVAAYRAGDADRAVRLAVHAYLEGFELAEPRLAAVDGALVREIEQGFIELRALAREGAPLAEVEATAQRLDDALLEAADKLGGGDASASATFVASLLILLREGLEAILVIAAMLAVVSRAGRPEARRWIHVGWVGAIALGVLTWFVASHLIALSGANREITEGVTALLAAAILVYVGYWLHDKSRADSWQQFINARLGVALSRGALWTLATVAFLATYREAFETVLFYQALAAHAGPSGVGPLLAGFAVAAVLLVAIAWLILKTSMRLPLGMFFRWSGLLLVALAIVFAGHGAAALQEAGVLGVSRVPFVSIPALGIHPTLQTLAAQAVALILSLILMWRNTNVEK